MFSKQTIGVFDWIIYFILSVIPPINIIMWIILLLSSHTNKTLRNFILAQIVLVLLALLLLIFGIVGGIQMGGRL